MSQRPDKIVTSAEAAKILGVSVSTAQQWINREIIPSWRTPGGHRRLFVGDVLNFAASLTTSAMEEVALPAEFVPSSNSSIPMPDYEAERLAALFQCNIVGTPQEQAFDRITALAAHLSDCPMALVTLVTAERQWFKSRVGVAVPETPRDVAFCSYAVMQKEPFVVEDAAADPRFSNNALVVGEPHVRFYAGFPIYGMDTLPLGTLCVLDREPRRLREREMTSMRLLAELASEEILRRSLNRTRSVKSELSASE